MRAVYEDRPRMVGLLAEHPAWFHVDAAQTAGRLAQAIGAAT